MKDRDKTVLVFGATGQQGGSVATALRSQGWQVKALVRDPKSDKAKALIVKGMPFNLRAAKSRCGESDRRSLHQL